MQRVFAMMNATVRTAKDMTFEFIRWVLIQLTQTIYTVARMALPVAHR